MKIGFSNLKNFFAPIFRVMRERIFWIKLFFVVFLLFSICLWYRSIFLDINSSNGGNYLQVKINKEVLEDLQKQEVTRNEKYISTSTPELPNPFFLEIKKENTPTSTETIKGKDSSAKPASSTKENKPLLQ